MHQRFIGTLKEWEKSCMYLKISDFVSSIIIKLADDLSQKGIDTKDCFN